MHGPQLSPAKCLCGLLVAALMAASPPAGRAEPRPLSEAERQAVALAAVYLSDGAEAWWERLAAQSPLRALGPELARREIELRAGSPTGARWRLQTVAAEAAATTAVFSIEFPSGTDEILVLQLAEEPDGWKLANLRMSAEPRGGFPAPGPALPAAGGLAGKMPGWPYPLIGGLAALVVTLILAAARRRGAAAIGAVTTALAVGAGAVMYVGLPGSQGQPPAPGTAAPQAPGSVFGPDLGKLHRLRLALAQLDPEALAAARRDLPTGQPARGVAHLWEAQHLLAARELNAVDHLLHGFPTPANLPLAELVRARLGVMRLQYVDAGLAYQRALDAGLRHDGLLLEAANTYLALGQDQRARILLEELEKLGTREAEVYYYLVGWALIDDAMTRACELFRTAWSLEPMRREQILSSPWLAYLVEDRIRLKDLLRLSSVEEPKGECRFPSRGAPELPEGAEARLLGSLLAIDLGSSELAVPGGCELAPAGTRVADAEAWLERREARSLAALPSLLERVKAPGALAQLRIRRQVEEAVAALVRHHRWNEVIALTAGVEGQVTSVPSELIRQRANALRHMDRIPEARTLLVALAKANAAGHRVDPGTLYQLGELLVAEGQYDLALRLIAKAYRQLPFEPSTERLLQIRIEKRLVTRSLIYESEHFRILYPQERTFYYAEKVAAILEGERERLRQWIPIASERVTEVLVPEWSDFRDGHGGTDMGVVGLFDGRIRVPLGGVSRFSPVIVAILTHELAHAMITEATRDQAPQWFQEGLAGHVQMAQERINPIAGYRQTGSLLAFPLIEAALSGFAAPRLVPIAYDEARWTLHFIDSEFGRRAIHGLLAAFAEGATTEEALQRVLGLSVKEFDRRLWEWCRDEAPELWPTELIDYGEVY